MARIVINFNEAEEGELRQRLNRIRATKETYYSARSESEAAKLVLTKGLEVVEKELKLIDKSEDS